jgi:hypothetical protein
VEAIMEEVYKDETILATTSRWESIRTVKNKLKKT